MILLFWKKGDGLKYHQEKFKDMLRSNTVPGPMKLTTFSIILKFSHSCKNLHKKTATFSQLQNWRIARKGSIETILLRYELTLTSALTPPKVAPPDAATEAAKAPCIFVETRLTLDLNAADPLNCILKSAADFTFRSAETPVESFIFTCNRVSWLFLILLLIYTVTIIYTKMTNPISILKYAFFPNKSFIIFLSLGQAVTATQTNILN